MDDKTLFDETKAYAPQEDVFFDDGREVELLHYIFGRSDVDELRGSPERVLAAIDEYGRTRKYLMNVGEDKGKIVTNLIAETRPKVMVSCNSILVASLGVMLMREPVRWNSGDMSDTRPFCSAARCARPAGRDT